MKLPPAALKALIPVAAAVAVAAGVTAFSLNAAADPAVQALGLQNAPANTLPRNENRYTFGSALDAQPGQEPDLVSAYGTNGQLGYVFYRDLNGPIPSSPEEALAIQAEQEAAGGVAIPLYSADGTTVIGEFRLEVPRDVVFK